MLKMSLLLARYFLLDDACYTALDMLAHSEELLLCRDHVGVLVSVRQTEQMDSIELALYSTHTAADTLVGIYYAASALEASLCFLLDLLFAELPDFVIHRELLALVDLSDLARRSLEVCRWDNDVILVEHCELTCIPVDHQMLTLIDESVQ